MITTLILSLPTVAVLAVAYGTDDPRAALLLVAAAIGWAVLVWLKPVRRWPPR